MLEISVLYKRSESGQPMSEESEVLMAVKYVHNEGHAKGLLEYPQCLLLAPIFVLGHCFKIGIRALRHLNWIPSGSLRVLNGLHWRVGRLC